MVSIQIFGLERRIGLEFLEELICLNVKLSAETELEARCCDWIADGEADGFATTNETAPPRYPLWSK